MQDLLPMSQALASIRHLTDSGLATLQRISGSDRTEHRKSAEKQTVHRLQVAIDFGTAGASAWNIVGTFSSSDIEPHLKPNLSHRSKLQLREGA
jgi:hypothetical protein